MTSMWFGSYSGVRVVDLRVGTARHTTGRAVDQRDEQQGMSSRR
jgi:hypothetical protein